MRRAFALVLAACGLAGASSPAIGASSAPVTYYYIPGSGYVPPGGPVGALARAPVVMGDAPPRAVDGDMQSGAVIGQYSLRAEEARVLLQPARGRRAEVPAGVALAKVVTASGHGPSVWCDLRPQPAGYRHAEHDCFADSLGVGRFDQVWIGESEGYFLGVGVSVVRSPKTLRAPAAYRPATPAEAPRAQLGYKWCGGDGVTTPPRFAVAMTAEGDPVWATDTLRGCALGVWPDAARRNEVEVDGWKLEISQGASPESLHYRFVDPRTAPGQKAVLAVSRAQSPQPSDPVGLKALLIDGPPTPSGGLLDKGQAFFSIRVRHGITGVLKNAVQSRSWISDRALPLDQPLYGVVMAGSGAATIVWCAPQQTKDKPPHWVAACLVDAGEKYVWVEAKPALMTVDLQWSGGGRTATPPSVERKAVELPPLILSYAFGGWNKEGAAVVDVQVDWGEGPQTLRSRAMPLGPDGAAVVTAMGGAIVIRRAPAAARVDQAMIEVRSPPRPDGELSY